MIRKTLLTAVALAALAVVPAAASAAAPLPLEGENLVSDVHTGGTVNPSCEDAASPSGASYTVSGLASGPYNGTFTETGTVKYDPTTPTPTLTGFTASYTITADDGTVVTGTKTNSQTADAVNFLNCAPWGVLYFGTAVDYSATIKTATGSFHDAGIGDANNVHDALVESFDLSTVGTPVPLAPTTASQCKKGGANTYGTMFKNQGDCVSFVATGGRNAGNGSYSTAPYGTRRLKYAAGPCRGSAEPGVHRLLPSNQRW